MTDHAAAEPTLDEPQDTPLGNLIGWLCLLTITGILYVL